MEDGALLNLSGSGTRWTNWNGRDSMGLLDLLGDLFNEKDVDDLSIPELRKELIHLRRISLQLRHGNPHRKKAVEARWKALVAAGDVKDVKVTPKPRRKTKGKKF